MAVIKVMDHKTYPELMKKKTISELCYIIKDARAAADAMPDGPNNGYYWDEVHYASMELRKREKGDR